MNRLEVSLQQTIITLAQRGWSQRRIARELAVDRETVKRYAPLAKPATNPTAGSEEPKPATGANPTAGSDAPDVAAEPAKPATAATNPTAGFLPGPPSRCEPHRAVIVAALERGLTAQRIHQDLCAEHSFQGSYESTKRFVRRIGATLPLPFRRIECAPGEEMQADFGQGAWIEADGKRRRPHLFRAMLSHSRKASSARMSRCSCETCPGRQLRDGSCAMKRTWPLSASRADPAEPAVEFTPDPLSS